MTDTPSPESAPCGTPVQVGTRTYTVAPMFLGPYRRLLPHLRALEADSTSLEHLEAVVVAAHQSIVRNHPEVTLEQLDNELDLEALLRVVKAMCCVPVSDRRAEA